ncbi:MAG TPA: tetratricopeptide repeat protein [Xanthobacteraceae bacterium]|nr:tetratricopeptide repeat protein [Xanthobacteraceae bacterium]
MARRSITRNSKSAPGGTPVRCEWRRVAAAAVLEVLVALAGWLAAPAVAGAAAAPIRGDLSVATAAGYARFVFRFGEDPDAEVRVANGILIISFKKPVDVPVDKAIAQAADYVGAARRDPDGTAVRLALSRKVTVNSMSAGERLFVDLMPDGWTGLPPGLPSEVVEELARRARDAERKFREQQQLARQRQQTPLRVRVGTQPTFTRYVFELPELIPITTDRGKDTLKVQFDAPWTFDLGDAQGALPPGVTSIRASSADDRVSVQFELNDKVQVRTFREDNNFVVDVPTPVEPHSKLPLPSGVAAAVAPAPEQKFPPATAPAPAAAPSTPAQAGPAPASPVSANPVPEAAPAAAAPVPAAATMLAVPLPVPRPVSAPRSRRAGNLAPPSAAAVPPAAAPPPVPLALARAEPDVPPSVTAAWPSPPPPPKGVAEPAPPPAMPRAVAAAPAAERPPDDAVAPAADRIDTRPGEPETAGPAALELPRAAPRTRVPQHVAAPAPPVGEANPPPADTVADAAADPVAAIGDSARPVMVQVLRQSDALRLVFPFRLPTSAAVFRRSDTLWLVFDTVAPVDISELVLQPIAAIRSAIVSRSGSGQVVRIRLDRPKLASLSSDGSAWTVAIGDMVLGPTLPLSIGRAVGSPGKASAVIPFTGARQVHRLSDPDVGDTLIAVTAPGPARGFLSPQDFVEFRVLASTHGVVVQPLADDLSVDLGPDKVVIGRSAGLTMSNAALRPATAPEAPEVTNRPGAARPLAFNSQLWNLDQQADFVKRQNDLIRAAAEAPEQKRADTRLDLARFYFARGLYPEAKGVLDTVLAASSGGAEDPSAVLLRAVANIMLGRGADALKDLARPVVVSRQDAALWRSVALSRQGKWAEARQGFQAIEATSLMLPADLQQIIYREALRTAIEIGDYAEAGDQLHQFDLLGVSSDLAPAMNVLRGRLAEGMGRITDALAAYRAAADSSDLRAAAQGELREIVLRLATHDLDRAAAISRLEPLTLTWRGDDTEVEALQVLGRLYTEEGRYRDAFQIMRTALSGHPDSPKTRRIQEEAAATFDVLFLEGKADSMQAIDALSLFYDFRELTPIGRRGDEMIRRLADRLASADLLSQAAELLQHQVDHRLEGVARAQVAVRLAVIYLMSHKPDRALQVLSVSRTGDQSNELRNQRLLLEARALSETGRHDVALEVVANVPGRDAERLRADVLWAAHKWRESAEQVERFYGDRWREFTPLSEPERADILRAGIGYALADDKLSLDRFRDKYAAKMAEGPDRKAFEVITAPLGTSGAEFGEVAKSVSSVDTLEGFLRDIRSRFPDAAGTTPTSDTAAPAPQSGAPGGPRPS